MTPEQVARAIQFLDSLHWDGIYPEIELDELQEAGIWNNRFTKTIFTGKKSIRSIVKTVEHFQLAYAIEATRHSRLSFKMKAFMGWEICDGVFRLAGIKPPPGIPRDREKRFNFLLKVLKKYVDDPASTD